MPLPLHWRVFLTVFMTSLQHSVQGHVVYLFRHCVRSVNASSLTPYTTLPFPSFGVPPDTCLPRGLAILENIGNELRAEVMEKDVVVVADNVTRNIQSMHALAQGLGLQLNSSSLRVDGAPFAHCNPPSSSEKDELMKQRWKTVPLPRDNAANFALVNGALQGLRNITAVPDVVEDGDFKGEHTLAATAATTFMMQLGGGMETAWGRLNASDIYQLDQMQVYTWAITRRAVPIERPKSSTMVAAILAALGGENVDNNISDNDHEDGPHTTIFVGHDTDVNGVGTLLGLGWSAPPLSDNTTAPSVGLRFESLADSKGILISFLAPTFHGSSAPGLPLHSSIISNDTVADFCRRLSTVDWSCAGHKPQKICH
eukprot:m.70511 g.70511  ORF g.70511 m.70511 type:complete len:370 (-) comp12140_c0_seq2:210-1319(-)